MDGIGTTHVAPTNLEQLRAWDGDEGQYWARHADQFDRAVTAYHERLLEVARIGPEDRVLDVGCGTGQTTRDAARRATAGLTVGIDLSAPMLAVARDRAAAEGVANVEHVQGDAQVHPFPEGGYDVAISRTGTMFFGDTGAGFTQPALEDLHAPMHFGDTAERAYDLVSGLMAWMVADLDEDTRRRTLEALHALLREHATADGVLFGSAMWLVTATRT